MKNLVLRSCCLAAIIWTFEAGVLAGDETISCTKEELMMFFPPAIVKSVLVKAQFTQQQADEIAKDLAGNDKKLAKIVDEKAEKENPNPFKDLSQRDQAIKIYQETLFEVFANVLKAHGVNDEHEIHQLLDEVRANKSRMFIECIRKSEQSK